MALRSWPWRYSDNRPYRRSQLGLLAPCGRVVAAAGRAARREGPLPVQRQHQHLRRPELPPVNVRLCVARMLAWVYASLYVLSAAQQRTAQGRRMYRCALLAAQKATRRWPRADNEPSLLSCSYIMASAYCCCYYVHLAYSRDIRHEVRLTTDGRSQNNTNRSFSSRRMMRYDALPGPARCDWQT